MAEFKEVVRKKNEMCNFYDRCRNCPLDIIDCHSTDETLLDTIERIVMNWEKSIDWSQVKVDTKILVRSSKKAEWLKRYFAKFEDGTVYVYSDGRTSWNNNGLSSWIYAKLWEGEE